MCLDEWCMQEGVEGWDRFHVREGECCKKSKHMGQKKY